MVTKQRAIALVDELEDRLGDLDVPLKISLNGCPNSCARSQVADIGLSGKVLTNDEGERVEGFQVHLGGAVGLRAGFGKKVRGNNVFSTDLGDYVVRVVENYKDGREDGESFGEWVVRADEELLV